MRLSLLRLALGLSLLALVGCSSDSGGDASASPSAGGAGGAGGRAGSGSGGTAAGSCDSDGDCKAPDTEPAGCARGLCDGGECRFVARDNDGDGVAAAKCKALKAGVVIELGKDCNDAKDNVHPGAWDGPKTAKDKDACDGVDNDCDGKIDNGVGPDGATCACTPGETRECDEDSKGQPIDWPKLVDGKPVGLCKRGGKKCTAEGKWDPCNGAILPVSEICDGKDNDCDDDVDEDVKNPPLWYYDGDDDGHGNQEIKPIESCANPGKKKINCLNGKASCEKLWKPEKDITTNQDCDDEDSSTHPGAWDGPAVDEVRYGIVSPGLEATFVPCIWGSCPGDLQISCDVPASPPSGGSCGAGKACNPITNEGCNSAAGEQCDLGLFGVYKCFPPPNDAPICGDCGGNSPPYCAPGLTCLQGVCARFCCTNEDCGTGHFCSKRFVDGQVGVCLQFDVKDIFDGTSPTRNDVAIHFDVQRGSIDDSVPPDAAGLWFGSVVAPATGAYTFYIYADDGVAMAIGGAWVLESWVLEEQPREHVVTVNLTKNTPISFQIDWFDLSHNTYASDQSTQGVIKVQWEGPGVERQVLTVQRLPDGGAKPDRCDKKNNDCIGGEDDQVFKATGKGAVLELSCSAVCNPVDPDVTKSLSRPCWSGEKIDLGICHEGSQRCLPSGTWSACAGEQGKELPEICDNRDSDCDGVSDIACSCKSGEIIKCGGTCNPHQETCSNEGTSDCKPPKEPGGVCASGQGACRRVGEIKCDGVYGKSGGTMCDFSTPLVSPSDYGTQKVGGSWDLDCDGIFPEFGVKSGPSAPSELLFYAATQAECTFPPASLPLNSVCSSFFPTQSACESAVFTYYCPGKEPTESLCGQTVQMFACAWFNDGCHSNPVGPSLQIYCK